MPDKKLDLKLNVTKTGTGITDTTTQVEALEKAVAKLVSSWGQLEKLNADKIQGSPPPSPPPNRSPSGGPRPNAQQPIVSSTDEQVREAEPVKPGTGRGPKPAAAPVPVVVAQSSTSSAGTAASSVPVLSREPVDPKEIARLKEKLAESQKYLEHAQRTYANSAPDSVLRAKASAQIYAEKSNISSFNSQIKQLVETQKSDDANGIPLSDQIIPPQTAAKIDKASAGVVSAIKAHRTRVAKESTTPLVNPNPPSTTVEPKVTNYDDLIEREHQALLARVIPAAAKKNTYWTPQARANSARKAKMDAAPLSSPDAAPLSDLLSKVSQTAVIPPTAPVPAPAAIIAAPAAPPPPPPTPPTAQGPSAPGGGDGGNGSKPPVAKQKGLTRQQLLQEVAMAREANKEYNPYAAQSADNTLNLLRDQIAQGPSKANNLARMSQITDAHGMRNISPLQNYSILADQLEDRYRNYRQDTMSPRRSVTQIAKRMFGVTDIEQNLEKSMRELRVGGQNAAAMEAQLPTFNTAQLGKGGLKFSGEEIKPTSLNYRQALDYRGSQLGSLDQHQSMLSKATDEGDKKKMAAAQALVAADQKEIAAINAVIAAMEKLGGKEALANSDAAKSQLGGLATTAKNSLDASNSMGTKIKTAGAMATSQGMFMGAMMIESAAVQAIIQGASDAGMALEQYLVNPLAQLRDMSEQAGKAAMGNLSGYMNQSGISGQQAYQLTQMAAGTEEARKQITAQNDMMATQYGGGNSSYSRMIHDTAKDFQNSIADQGAFGGVNQTLRQDWGPAGNFAAELINAGGDFLQAPANLVGDLSKGRLTSPLDYTQPMPANGGDWRTDAVTGKTASSQSVYDDMKSFGMSQAALDAFKKYLDAHGGQEANVADTMTAWTAAQNLNQENYQKAAAGQLDPETVAKNFGNADATKQRNQQASWFAEQQRVANMQNQAGAGVSRLTQGYSVTDTERQALAGINDELEKQLELAGKTAYAMQQTMRTQAWAHDDQEYSIQQNRMQAQYNALLNQGGNDIYGQVAANQALSHQYDLQSQYLNAQSAALSLQKGYWQVGNSLASAGIAGVNESGFQVAAQEKQAAANAKWDIAGLGIQSQQNQLTLNQNANANAGWTLGIQQQMYSLTLAMQDSTRAYSFGVTQRQESYDLQQYQINVVDPMVTKFTQEIGNYYANWNYVENVAQTQLAQSSTPWGSSAGDAIKTALSGTGASMGNDAGAAIMTYMTNNLPGLINPTTPTSGSNGVETPNYKAAGGLVYPGQSAIVGENGIESLDWMNGAVRITPNQQLGKPGRSLSGATSGSSMGSVVSGPVEVNISGSGSAIIDDLLTTITNQIFVKLEHNREFFKRYP